jgi:hypothetical protein
MVRRPSKIKRNLTVIPPYKYTPVKSTSGEWKNISNDMAVIVGIDPGITTPTNATEWEFIIPDATNTYGIASYRYGWENFGAPAAGDAVLPLNVIIHLLVPPGSLLRFRISGVLTDFGAQVIYCDSTEHDSLALALAIL